MHLRSDSSSGHPLVFDLQKKSFTDNSDELCRLFLHQQPPMKIPLQMSIPKINFFFLIWIFFIVYLSVYIYCSRLDLLMPISRIKPSWT
ncbi:unnamed protein product [Brassica oleracea var. botrytis]